MAEPVFKEVFMKNFIDKVVNEKIHRIYVCSPLSAPTKGEITRNMEAARRKCGEINAVFGGRAKAWAPHAYIPEMLDDTIAEERKIGMEFGMELLKRSDIVYVFGSHLSAGMRSEIKYAAENNIDIAVESGLLEKVEEYVETVTGVERA